MATWRKRCSGASPDANDSAKASSREGVVTARSLTGLHRVLLLVSAVECGSPGALEELYAKRAMSCAAG